jgi:hypothetical protein
MSEIDKVTRLLELATLHRLREQLDLAAPSTSEAPEPLDRAAREEPEVVAKNENTEPVSG